VWQGQLLDEYSNVRVHKYTEATQLLGEGGKSMKKYSV
jgi:hypothetical protein